MAGHPEARALSGVVEADSRTLQRIVSWAEADEHVRAVFLVGSRGEMGGRPDALSDFDVLVFAREAARYEADDGWLSTFGSILVKLHEEYEVLGVGVATRLVQYQDGSRVDFSICDLGLFDRISGEAKLPNLLDRGYRALVDKDEWAARLPEPTGKAQAVGPPTEVRYEEVVNEFWWEVIYVAKHLARGEILPALYSHECVIRFRCLVPMLEWHAQLVHGSEARTGPHGRGLLRELGKDEVDRFSRTFLGPSVQEAWSGLLATADCFREIAGDVAKQLGFSAQDELADGVEALLRRLRGTQPRR